MIEWYAMLKNRKNSANIVSHSGVQLDHTRRISHMAKIKVSIWISSKLQSFSHF